VLDEALFLPDTNLRSTDVERYTPKFLKNWETQLFQKYLGIRFVSDTKDALLIIAEAPSSRSFSDVCKFQLHSAGVGSRRLIPTCNRLIACWYESPTSKSLPEYLPDPRSHLHASTST